MGWDTVICICFVLVAIGVITVRQNRVLRRLEDLERRPLSQVSAKAVADLQSQVDVLGRKIGVGDVKGVKASDPLPKTTAERTVEAVDEIVGKVGGMVKGADLVRLHSWADREKREAVAKEKPGSEEDREYVVTVWANGIPQEVFDVTVMVLNASTFKAVTRRKGRAVGMLEFDRFGVKALWKDAYAKSADRVTWEPKSLAA